MWRGGVSPVTAENRTAMAMASSSLADSRAFRLTAEAVAAVSLVACRGGWKHRAEATAIAAPRDLQELE
ncbi:hypothetical protein GCM10023328_47880 [Modestobacter marinus]|uniref:Uncharacterized protein n=1 Tax=Modestobacter marinus TaxID=477641 RepID=A0ABQ2GCK2_9ACTN|nr:hypothetical protein GCM10011589_47690 [Modestobacter marinus]